MRTIEGKTSTEKERLPCPNHLRETKKKETEKVCPNVKLPLDAPLLPFVLFPEEDKFYPPFFWLENAKTNFLLSPI